MLVSAGCEVTTAVDGPEGLHLAENGDFDGVLLDLCMPKMSGNLVYSRIRSIFPDLPIVFMSGLISEARLRKFADGSDFLFIEKPFQRHELISVLTRACNGISGVSSRVASC